jgi:sugar lactone lactonase YvrE
MGWKTGRRWLSAVGLVLAWLAPTLGQAQAVRTLTPKVFPVGKWPEGVAATAEGVFVAESGQRTVVLLDPDTGAVRSRERVGRLPVGIAQDAEGRISVLVQTDRRVWRASPVGPSAAFSDLPGCPAGLAQSRSFVWVLVHPDCSSETGQLLRINPLTGERVQSPMLGVWTQALAVSQGQVAVVHARPPPSLDLVDEATLQVRQAGPPDLSAWSIAVGAGQIFIGGGLETNPGQGAVVWIDPVSGQERGRALVDQRIEALAADETDVVAVGEKGRLWVFSALDLAPRSVIDLSIGPFPARAVAIRGDRLFVTNTQKDSGNGALLVIDDWRSGAPSGLVPLNDRIRECPYQVHGVKAPDVLLLHTGPDSGTAWIARIPPDATGLRLKRCLRGARDWCEVEYGDKTGWVDGAYIGADCR